MLKVVHYLNQFFAGLGGEDQAEIGPQVREGFIGPGMELQKLLDNQGTISATVICGDNYFTENIDSASDQVIELMTPIEPDLVIAGPAFNAGRYGIACGAVCKAAIEKLGVPALTAMYEENPGLDLYRQDVYILPTEDSVKGMAAAAKAMVQFGLKLAAGQSIGRPADEGYFPRGILVNEFLELNGADRSVAMLLRKLKGETYISEVPRPNYRQVRPAPRIEDLAHARIALVTDGGLVPKGNPDNIEMRTATRYGKYALKGIARLGSENYEVKHGGYDSVLVRQDPNRLVPVDAMRELEKEGRIGTLHDFFYSTTGVANIVETMEKMGAAMAEELVAEGVSGVILTSTWGTSTRCGATLAKEIERAGIPTAHICSIVPVALMVGSNRIITGSKIVNPVGSVDLPPAGERDFRRRIVEQALDALQIEVKEPTVFESAA